MAVTVYTSEAYSDEQPYDEGEEEVPDAPEELPLNPSVEIDAASDEVLDAGEEFVVNNMQPEDRTTPRRQTEKPL